MAHTDDRRRVRGTLLRAVAGIVTVILGIAVVSCSSPTQNSSNDPSGGATATTAVDTGTGPTSITKTFRAIEVSKGFDKASNIVSRPMRNQLWITQRSGAVRVIEIETAWSLELGQTQRSALKAYPTPIFELSGDISTEGERGLLGIAFATDARTLFLSYDCACSHRSRRSVHVLDYDDNDNDCCTDYHANDSHSPGPYR